MKVVKYDELIKETKEELEELLKKERDVRIYMIYLLKTSPNIQLKDVSEKLAISIQSVKKYLETYH